MSTPTICPICRGPEPSTINRMLLLGWSPRFLSARWGHTRKAIARHRDVCLTEYERENVKRDLSAMASRGSRLGGEG